MLRIDVQDTGIGIPLRVQELIFERLPKSTSRPRGATAAPASGSPSRASSPI